MDNKEIKKKLKQMAKKYPLVASFEIFYYGSGDSFDSFDLQEIKLRKDANNVKVDIVNSDFEDVFWELVERAGANFNNDGGEGTVIFDLENNRVSINDYFRVSETQLNQSIEI